MTDNNFLQEIQEDLDRQKLETLWKRYGGVALFGAVVIVVSTAGMSWWHSWRTEHEQQATAGLVAIAENKHMDTEKQIEILEVFAQKNHGVTQAAFAQLHAAALAANEGKKDKAVELYNNVAKDDSVDTSFRQLADLLAVQVQMDGGDAAVLQKRLWPLEKTGAPWRFAAMELEGHLALHAGDKAKAKQIFTELSQNASAPPTLGARATDMLRFVSE